MEEIKPYNTEKAEQEAALAARYVDMPKENLESGIKNSLSRIEGLEAGQSAEFLKGALNLEMHYYLRDINPREAEEFLGKAFEALSAVSEKEEDFEIIYKDKEGKEIIFGNRSLAGAYLGDIYVKKYFEGGDAANWQKGQELYEQAVKNESEPGRSHELKTILSIRKIAKNLGDEKAVRCRKTTRREDLRNETGDLYLEYTDDKKKLHSGYIDITGRPSGEKEQKGKYSPTAVAYIPPKAVDLISGLGFEEPFVVQEENGSRAALGRIKEALSAFAVLSSKLETALGLKESEKAEFRRRFFMNEEKFHKFFPSIKKEQISALASQW